MSIEKQATVKDLAAARADWRSKKIVLIDKFARLAELGCDQAEALLRKGDASGARNAAVMSAVAFDKASLAAGDPTSRSEELSARVDVDPGAVSRLLAEMSANPSDGHRRNDAANAAIEAESTIKPAQLVEAPALVLVESSEPEPVNPHNGDRWNGRTWDLRWGWVDDAASVDS